MTITSEFEVHLIRFEAK